ncbi:MFS transporter [Mycobacterium sp. pUA109]|uniref:MFS transporter n=1 Tax=Mycobacterium sp. pUA109 TaxID=3238982 RepID=UPI00351BE3DB
MVCFSLVAALVGLALLDRVGRKPMQLAGFGLSALSMVLISAIPGLTAAVAPFALVFGLSLFGIAFGPNYTTMLLAAESYPTSIRSTAHGISAAFGKIGAFLGALISPVVLAHFGLRPTTLIAGGCFLLGIATTLALVEPNGVALDCVGIDEGNGDATMAPAEATYA